MCDGVVVKFRKLSANAVVPVRAHDGDAGLDVAISHAITLEPGERTLAHTALAVEIPPGFEGQVRPRSGLALKHGVTVLNAPGTIDSGYRGELCVILVNLGEEPFTAEAGTRIAQLVIAPVTFAKVELHDVLSESCRGGRGFGSTGR